MEWTKQKPDFACIFLTKQKDEYNLWRFQWELSEQTNDESIDLYLAWFDNDGGEWDDILDCNFDKYLILEILPTFEQVSKQIIESRIKNM